MTCALLVALGMVEDWKMARSLGRMVEKPAIFSHPSRRNEVVNVSSVFMSTSSGCDKAVRSENKSD